jgi:hypothetical protein
VEQQGVPIDAFVARRSQATWERIRALLPTWDERIAEFNAQAAVARVG